MKRKLIYLSSPFTNGNKKLNVYSHLAMFEALSKAYPNCTFYAPLVYAHFGFDRTDPFWSDENFWITYDLEMLKRCDALFVFDSRNEALDYLEFFKNSIGCKKEIGVALQNGIPVYEESEFLDLDKYLRLL